MSTGKEVEVTITRLIPASSNRIADVTSAVWQALGLTSNTEAKIYTVVSAKPQSTATQLTVPQSAGTQSAGTQSSAGSHSAGGSQIVSSQPTGTSTARTSGTGGTTGNSGTGSGFLDNMPTGVKFENNNNFTFYNGSSPYVPPAVAYDTQAQTPPQPAPASNTPSPAQPSVTYEQRPQPAQPVVIVDNWPQPAAQPLVTYEPKPQPTVQPTVTYEPGPQSAQPVVIVDNWQKSAQLAYETRPRGVDDVWARVAMPPGLLEKMSQTGRTAVSGETPAQEFPVMPVEKYIPDIRANTVNEILSPATRTVVLIDSSPETSVPSVTINNGQQSHRSVPAVGDFGN